MRLTIATLLLATLVIAHPSADGSRGHDAISKRHRSRGLLGSNSTVSAFGPDKREALLARILAHEHTLDEIPDGFEFPEDGERDPALFTDTWEDDWELPPAEFDPHDNGTTRVLDDREFELELRATGPKQGIAWTNELMGSLYLFKGKVFGLYTWTEWWPDEAKQNNIKFFPMLKTYEKRDKFKNTVKKGYGAGYTMAMNEVNLASQANLDPGKAAWMIRTYLIPLRDKYGMKIVGPSTANGPSALAWYDKFRSSAPDVWKKIDAINLHYYGLDYKQVIQWMKDWHTRYGKTIWLTEYGCHSFSGKGSCTAAQAKTFMTEIAKFCESQSWCQTHMIYGSFINSRTGVSKVNALYASKSSLSALGKAYIAV